MRILGVDPGSVVMGYAIIDVPDGNTVDFVMMDVLRLNKISDQASKLRIVLEEMNYIITSFRPNVLAIEAPFQGKNPQSMLKLGRVQGVAMAVAMLNNLPVFEYSPRTVKQTVTGTGAASKETVARFLHNITQQDFSQPKYLDATDALAVAICHQIQSKPNRIEVHSQKKIKKSAS
ncbi:MAG: crossover junction endodeoxyribonuclease RuvC, partial [Bacteroidales bacterium]|nr:crossover junction endodeoxyribonuclease RuvC [Bacteroidales bacterium]